METIQVKSISDFINNLQSILQSIQNPSGFNLTKHKQTKVIHNPTCLKSTMELNHQQITIEMDNKNCVNKKVTPKPLEIDYKKLENDLESKIREDELYWVRNEAKLRAVTQGTPTYEDFRQIVLAANLKPISKEEKEELERKSAGGQVIWNRMAGGGGERRDSGTHGQDETKAGHDEIKDGHDEINKTKVSQVKQLTPAKTTSDFMKTWRDLNKSRERLEYLRCLAKGGGDSRSGLERLEFFPIEIFPEFVHSIHEEMVGHKESSALTDQVMNGSVPAALAGEVIWILYVVSECKRFRIGLSFLDEGSKMKIGEILNVLEKSVGITTGNEEKSVRELFDLVKIRYGDC